jgi:hypothetical protein
VTSKLVPDAGSGKTGVFPFQRGGDRSAQMSRDPRFIELDDHPQEGPPAETERVLTGPAVGAAIGLAIGIALDLAFDRFGNRSNPLAVLAVPIAATVIGLTMGMLLSVAGRSRLDAPVRDRRFLRRRRASTTEYVDPAGRG